MGVGVDESEGDNDDDISVGVWWVMASEWAYEAGHGCPG
jgi:hypothetical protein